ncbi:MAG: hypothetical protein Fur0037_02290 [Planctomycetota bacterium]
MDGGSSAASEMNWFTGFWKSSVGGKVTMAVTGVLLFLFLIAHLLGNLQLLMGREAINHYAEFLHSKPVLVWIARIVLLAVFALHVVTSIRLSLENRRARPVAYECEETVEATWASRSMLLTGLTTGAFLIYHLLHFTIGGVHRGYFALKEQGPGGMDVYSMVTESFRNPFIALAYISFMVLLFFHLSHGIQSFVQTLGFHRARCTRIVKGCSFAFAAAIAGGNIFLAVACLIGIVS